MMKNKDKEGVGKILNCLFEQGVREVVCSPGGRNAELWQAFLNDPRFKTFKAYDERTASFYALGKSYTSPTVVLVTSGSALAHTFGAVLESHYQKDSKLVVLSADRPFKYRGTGAPQCIEQKNFFGSYVREHLDVEVEDFKSCKIDSFPFHLNIGFDDPNPLVLEKKKGVNCLGPLVIISSLTLKEKEEVKKALQSYSGALVLESLSNLGSEDFPKTTVLDGYGVGHTLLDTPEVFHTIYRIGGVPVLKLWREAEQLNSVYWDRYFFSGAVGAKSLSLEDISKSLAENATGFAIRDSKQNLNKALLRKKDVKKTSKEEVLLKELSLRIPEKAKVFLGNSLPIREWEFCKQRSWTHIGQRGVNGIDGSLALALGQASEIQENWIVLGDLTFLYNFNDLQLLKTLPVSTKVRIVVVNNCGGQIFSKVIKEKVFEFVNEQDADIEKIAQAWGVSYVKFSAEKISLSDKCLIEVVV